MRISRIMAFLCFAYSTTLLAGCGEAKTEIPKNLKQTLPPAPVSNGGSGAKNAAGSPPSARAE